MTYDTHKSLQWLTLTKVVTLWLSSFLTSITLRCSNSEMLNNLSNTKQKLEYRTATLPCPTWLTKNTLVHQLHQLPYRTLRHNALSGTSKPSLCDCITTQHHCHYIWHLLLYCGHFWHATEDWVAPYVDIIIHRGRFWAKSAASGSVMWCCFRYCWTVLSYVMWGRPSCLLQSAGGEANRILLASALTSMHIICPNMVSRCNWIIAVSLGCFISLRTSSFWTNWYHLMPSSICRHPWKQPNKSKAKWQTYCCIVRPDGK